jgi:glyoxylase-like metal-dependent hydrolase (beta-lactamase superfamily II)
MHPQVTPFFHAASSTWSYVVSDPGSRRAVVIDPVLDFDYPSGALATASVEAIIAHVRGTGLHLEWILETHAHADHLSAAPQLQQALGGRIAIGSGIRTVQSHFKQALHLEADFAADGAPFDHLFNDGDTFSVGGIPTNVIATPGHTRDSISYRIGDALFVGDTLFMPDSGTARCDFPGGDAGTLYDSVQRLFELPRSTRLFVCHDYAPGGREHRCETTVSDQRQANIHVRNGITRDAFIALRQARDQTLGMPALLYPAVQVNVRAGHLPPPEANGISYLKVPLIPPVDAAA